MIRGITDVESATVLRAEVAVVGAGLAGIDVACALGRRGIRVVLLESGRLEFDPAIQELARVTCVGVPLRTPETHGHLSTFLPPMYRGYCRVRQFGGTTNVWTGKWRMFDAWDFEPRPWIPYSGWPIALEDVLPFYEETGRDYGFGDFRAESERDPFRLARRLLAPAGLEPHLFYWEETPTRAGPRFFQELKRSEHVDVLLGATATELVLDENLRTVRELSVATLDGRRIAVRADRFVLATGGLEAPRLLLASNRQIAEGIGNAHGLVGRFYMDHPKHKGTTLRPGPALRRIFDGLNTRPRPRFGFSLAFSGDAQRARSLPNHAVFLRPVGRTLAGRTGRFSVKLGLEQVPDPDSRVYLGTDRDALGVPRLVVDWRFTPRDHDAFARLQGAIAGAFLAAGIGHADSGSRPLTLDDVVDASHHMGTTRMAADPSAGVVDRDCRVFGTDNLYIASSAVFPTAHAYSPTFTILALARRLTVHLGTLHQAPPPRVATPR